MLMQGCEDILLYYLLSFIVLSAKAALNAGLCFQILIPHRILVTIFPGL